MTSQDKAAIEGAKGPSWKKVLLWVGVGLLLISGITVLLVMLLRKNGPVAATKAIIQKAKAANTKADIEAKIEIAKARAAEDAVIKELERIKEIEDEEEQAKRLAELL